MSDVSDGTGKTVSRSWRWPRHYPPLAASLLLTLFVFIAVFGPALSPYAADQLGRDLATRIVHGARLSLILALIGVGGAGAIGIGLGLIAGYSRSWVSDLIMRVVDAFLALPFFLVALAFVAALGVSVTNIIIVMALTTWPPFTRLVRGEALRVREADFVALARVSGVPGWRIALVHVLPNVMNGVIVLATLDVGRVILLESGLSFLGLGVQPPTVSWGLLLADGKQFMTFAWWLTVLPGLALLITVLSFNILGDWLRDRFDPRLESA